MTDATLVRKVAALVRAARPDCTFAQIVLDRQGKLLPDVIVVISNGHAVCRPYADLAKGKPGKRTTTG